MIAYDLSDTDKNFPGNLPTCELAPPMPKELMLIRSALWGGNLVGTRGTIRR